MGKYKNKNDRKRNPNYYSAGGGLVIGSNMCKCYEPKPTGEWSVRDDKSYATCECGKEYRTILVETVFGE